MKGAAAYVYRSYARGGKYNMLLLCRGTDVTEKSGFASACLAREEKAAVCILQYLKGFGKLFIAGVYGRVLVQCGNGLLEYEFFAFVWLVYLWLTDRNGRLCLLCLIFCTLCVVLVFIVLFFRLLRSGGLDWLGGAGE